MFGCFQYALLKDLQRQSYIHYFYEATVGAGLPIISTLRGLLETGDKIVKVEGIFRSVRISHSSLSNHTRKTPDEQYSEMSSG